VVVNKEKIVSQDHGDEELGNNFIKWHRTIGCFEKKGIELLNVSKWNKKFSNISLKGTTLRFVIKSCKKSKILMCLF
jgi:hypothetical protein